MASDAYVSKTRILLRYTVLLAALLFLGACASGPSGSARDDGSDSPVLEQFAGMSVDEIMQSGNVALQAGETERALFIYTQALALEDDPEIWLKVGRIHAYLDQHVYAWQSFESVLRLDPDNAVAHEELGILYVESKQRIPAQKHLKRATEIDPGRWRANNTLGVLADTERDYPAAIAYYEAALDANPNSALLLTNLGYSHYLAGRLEDAERYFRVAFGVDRDYRPATANLGLVYARRGQYDYAVDILQNIMDRPKAFNDVGYIAYNNGDLEQAKELLSEAIRLSPVYYETARKNLENVRKERNARRPTSIDIASTNKGPGYFGLDQFDSTNSERRDYRKVAVWSLNLRQSGNLNAPIVGFLHADQHVEVHHDNGEWVFVSFGDGPLEERDKGWVSGKYLAKLTQMPAPNAGAGAPAASIPRQASPADP